MEKVCSLTKRTHKKPDDVLQQATKYFGPQGLGLQVTEHTTVAARFVGGGGHIRVEMTKTAQDSGTRVEIRTSGWDYHVKRFLGGI
jgi:hypothetical protein